MGIKDEKKSRLKKLKQQQKLNREKNKKAVEDIIENFTYNDMTKFSGIRAYVIITLKEIINSLSDEKYNRGEILFIATEFRNLVYNPLKSYKDFISKNKDKIRKEDKYILKVLDKEPKFSINTTERALLKVEMEAVIMEFATKYTDYESIDYGAIKVCFQTAYHAILKGLDEKKIKSLEIYVGYGDVLVDINIDYDESDEKYNLDEQIIIFPNWKSLDNLYNEYTKFKTKYVNFSESSINSLATAVATEKEFKNRKEGKHIISYNGIALNYLSVLEVELKKLVYQKTGISSRSIRLVETINKLHELNLGILSEEYVIEDLHKIRQIRNNVAHGISISYEELDFIKEVLIGSDLLISISNELILNSKTKDDENLSRFKESTYKEQPKYNWGNGIYKGKIINGKRSGKGIFYYLDGDLYEGDFQDDKIQGHGVMKMADGAMYIGEWKNFMFNGKGKLYYSTGEYYEGDFRSGKRHGKGVFIDPKVNGGRYEGEWKDDIKFGLGSLYHLNGEVYVGEFGEGGYEGKGKFIWPDGCVYEGQFKNDMASGNGIYTWPDGTRYVGSFLNSKKHGLGTMYYADGEIRELEYENEQIIRVIKSNWK